MLDGAARLGEILLGRDLLTREQLEICLQAQVQRGVRLGTLLAEHGFVQLDDISDALGEQHGVPVATADVLQAISSGVLGAVPRNVCEKYNVFPLAVDGRALSLAMRDPQLLDLVDRMGTLLNMDIVEPYALAEARLFYLLEIHYQIPRASRYLRAPGTPVPADRRRYLEPTFSPSAPPQRRRTGPVPIWESWNQQPAGAEDHTGPFRIPRRETPPLGAPTARGAARVTGPVRPIGAPPRPRTDTPARFVVPTELAGLSGPGEPRPEALQPAPKQETGDFEIVVEDESRTTAKVTAISEAVEAPGSIDEAVQAIDQAVSRESLIEQLLQPLLPETSASVLFVVRGKLMTAEGAWGSDRPLEHLQSLVVAIKDSPLLQLALADETCVRAEVSADGLQQEIASHLGAPSPRDSCLLPIWVDNRPASLLCLQSERGFAEDAADRLDAVGEAARKAFARLRSEASVTLRARTTTPTGRSTPATPSQPRRRPTPPRATTSGPLVILPEEEREFGRYTLICRLASGGMAALYLAELVGPDGFEKLVAIKRIHEHLGDQTEFIKMFSDEARLVARISHPNVVQVIEFGFEQASYFIAMEYVDGESLSALLRRKRLPIPACARIVAHAAAGLHAAHELRGKNGKPLAVVHRDVSPENILLSYDGAVKVVDFGVAKAAGNLHITSAGTRKGKFSYMAPEQLHLEDVDRRADIFALGIVLYETSTHSPLFRAPTEQATIARIESGEILPPSWHVPEYPEALEKIAMKALERDPEKRYQTADEMYADLERYIMATGSPVLTSAISQLMHEVFADRIQLKQDVLSALGG